MNRKTNDLVEAFAEALQMKNDTLPPEVALEGAKDIVYGPILPQCKGCEHCTCKEEIL
jgi:hypothetical protein